MHDTFWDEGFDGALSESERMSVFARLGDPAIGWYLAPVWQRGWELFADIVPSDVAEAMLRLRDDPDLLARELAKGPKTFIHGDLRLHNLGLDGSRIVLFDWEVAGIGTPAAEVSWYLIISASRIGASREQVIDDYRAIAGDTFDERMWDVACLFALVALGWNKAIDIVDGGDDALRAQERADLDWWVNRVRSALETWSPV
jgi:aminoglycoside phosphotransferase (APT) family kinase protein